MANRNYDEIDEQLAALGAVPADAELRALLRRYLGEKITLANVDALLGALGEPAAMPPRLQPTVVDLAAPSADPDAENPAPIEPAAEPAMQLDSNVSEPPLPSSRGHFPWDSEPPMASIEAQMASDSEPVAPPPPRAPDFDSLFNDAAVEAAPHIVEPALRNMSRPPIPAGPSSARPRHDTMEYMPAVSLQLAPISALDLNEAVDSGSAPAPEDTAQSDATPTRESQAPEMTVGTDDADEFEILVDDEILEIDEDEVSSDEPADE